MPTMVLMTMKRRSSHCMGRSRMNISIAGRSYPLPKAHIMILKQKQIVRSIAVHKAN